MKRVKITVLKTTLDKQLAEEYGAKGLGPCPMLKEGQVFYADYAKPDGFCDEAWKAIYQYAFALSHGAANDVFITGTGFENRGSPYAAATMDCVRLFLNWKQPRKIR